MFVEDGPFAIDLAEADRQTKPEVGSASVVLSSRAPHPRHDESDVLSSRDVQIINIEDGKVTAPGKECVPRFSVSIEADGLERRRNVEHHKIRRVIGDDARHVSSPDCMRPFLHERLDLLLVARVIPDLHGCSYVTPPALARATRHNVRIQNSCKGRRHISALARRPAITRPSRAA